MKSEPNAPGWATDLKNAIYQYVNKKPLSLNNNNKISLQIYDFIFS